MRWFMVLLKWLTDIYDQRPEWVPSLQIRLDRELDGICATVSDVVLAHPGTIFFTNEEDIIMIVVFCVVYTCCYI